MSKISAALALLAIICLSGCGSSTSGYLKVINTSPGSGIVDARSGGTFIATELAFGTATPSYSRSGTGSSQPINFYPTGKSTVAATARQAVLKNTYYTVLQTGISSSPKVQVTTDDLTPPGTGDFKIRVIHAAPSAPSVDIYVSAPGDPPLYCANGVVKPTLTDVALDSVGSYMSLASGTYEIRVTATGGCTVFITNGKAGATLAGGLIYTAVALDPDPTVMGATFSLLVTQDTPVAGVVPVAPPSM